MYKQAITRVLLLLCALVFVLSVLLVETVSETRGFALEQAPAPLMSSSLEGPAAARPSQPDPEPSHPSHAPPSSKGKPGSPNPAYTLPPSQKEDPPAETGRPSSSESRIQIVLPSRPSKPGSRPSSRYTDSRPEPSSEEESSSSQGSSEAESESTPETPSAPDSSQESQPESSLPASSETSTPDTSSEPVPSEVIPSEPAFSETDSSETSFPDVSSSEASSSEASSSEPASSQPKPSSSDSSSEELEQLRLENDQCQDRIVQKYTLTVTVARNEEDSSREEIIAYAEDERTIAQMLNQIERALGQFPSDYLDPANELILAGEAEPSRQEDSFFLCCDTGTDIRELQEFLSGRTCVQFENALEEGWFELEFEELNPADFMYGIPREEYLFSEDNIYTGYFWSLEAQEDPVFELKELFHLLFEENLPELVPEDTPFFGKLERFCLQLTEWEPGFAEVKAVQYFSGLELSTEAAGFFSILSEWWGQIWAAIQNSAYKTG